MSTNKNNQATLATQLIAGTRKHFANVPSLSFEGATFTPAQLETSLQTIIDLRSAVDDAKATTRSKVAAEAVQAPPLRSQMAAFVAYVRATFGNSPDTLADFGLKPRKVRAPLTVTQKATAAAKRAATRAARGTKGPKQKKAVKGNVIAVTVTPVTTTQPASTTESPPTPTPAAGVQPAAGNPTAGAGSPAATVSPPHTA
jgi:hypothetical protein